MLPADIEKSLTLIEMQCQAVAAAVGSGEPQALEAASNALRQTAMDFSALMGRVGASTLHSDRELQARLKKLAASLGIQRENLLRRSVVVERALHAMVPATRKSTYSAPAGRAGSYKAFSA